MSGGIDSTVAALMLHKEGYEVVGITMKTWDYATSVGVTGKKSEGENWERPGHQKITTTVTTDLNLISKIYTDGKSIWLYREGEAISAYLRIVVNDLGNPPLIQKQEFFRDRNAQGLMIETTASSAALDSVVGDLWHVKQICKQAADG